MADATYVASALLMGALLVAVIALLRGVRLANRTGTGGSVATDRPRSRTARTSWADRTTDAARNPLAWVAGFLLFAFGSAAGAVLYVADVAMPVAGRVVGLAIAAVVLFMLVSYLLVGTYLSARHRGRHSAQAVAEGIGVLGLLGVVAIVVRLVVLA